MIILRSEYPKHRGRDYISIMNEHTGCLISFVSNQKAQISQELALPRFSPLSLPAPAMPHHLKPFFPTQGKPQMSNPKC